MIDVLHYKSINYIHLLFTITSDTSDVLMFMQQTPATNRIVFYRVRYGAVRYIHLVIPIPDAINISERPKYFIVYGSSQQGLQH